MATNNENKGIFVKTIELIGSVIAIMLFTTLLFGIFTSSLEKMLWQLFDWFIEILKPIVSILLLFVGVFRGIPLLVSFIESIIEDIRSEKEYTEVWERLDRVPTLQLETAQKPLPEVKEEAKTDQTTQSRGINVNHSETEKGGLVGEFSQPDYNTLEGLEPGSKKAQDAYKNSKERQERLKAMHEIDEKIKKIEMQEAANEKLKDLKNIFLSKKGCKVE